MNCVTLVKGQTGGQLFATSAGWISLDQLKAETGLADDEIRASYFELYCERPLSNDEVDIDLSQIEEEEVQVVSIIHNRAYLVPAEVRIKNGVAYLDESLYDSVFC